ncbi:MAG: serine hydrolase domain-containing protein, partial [Thermomonas sp.]
AAAWRAYDARAGWVLKLASDRARRDGWDQIRSYAYQTSPSDQRVVSAQALRHGQRWTVAITDMAEGVFGKRESQVELVYQRLWPKGYARETFAGRVANKLDGTRIETLKRFIEHARQEFDVPGVAIGVVQDGKVLFAGGFGVRELGKRDAVDADTLFMIASNTKALTTLMLAKQVDAGRFGWNTPVVQVLPSFSLGDADTTGKVRMQHLVCACTGLPRQDMEMLFDSEGGSPASLMALLATMQPTSAFGELYQYSNAMAAAAGFAGGHAFRPELELGAGYDAAIQSLVFDPLEMSATTFDFARALGGNHAMPHASDVRGMTTLVDIDLNEYVIPSRPDGGAWSSVNDMLRYVRMELAEGLLEDGTRYIGTAPLLERRVQQVATGSDTGYGMGLKLDRSMGTLLIHHGGTEFGFRSDMLWLPEHGVGAVILTNAEAGAGLRYPFRRRLLELLFDGKPEAEENVAVQSKRNVASHAANMVGLAVPADSNATGLLAARYRSAELGEIEISRRNGAVWFDFGGWKSEVATRRNDDGTFSFVTIAPAADGFEFTVADRDGKRALVLLDEQHEYVFTAVE